MELVEFRLIGRGPAAVVYAATRVTGEPVAVKVLDAPGDAAGWDRFDAIGAVVAGLAGRVALVGGVQVERSRTGSPVLVGPLFSGGSLAGLVERRGPLSPEEAVGVGETVAGALAALHEAGLVHGSVSPTNLLLSDGGAVVLVDAGASLVAPRPVGSHGAPELRGGAATGAADVYALASVLDALIQGHPAAPAREVRELLTASFDPDPNHRPSASEFQSRLGNCDMAPLFDRRRPVASIPLGPIVADPRPAGPPPAVVDPLDRHDDAVRRQRRIAAWIGVAAAVIGVIAFLGGRGTDDDGDRSDAAASASVATTPPLATALAATTSADRPTTTPATATIATPPELTSTLADAAATLTTSTVPPPTTIRRATTTVVVTTAPPGPASTAPVADPSTTVRLAGPPSLPPTTTMPAPPTVTVPGSVDQPVPVTTIPPATAAPTTAPPITVATTVAPRPTVGSLSVSTSSNGVRVVANSADRCASSRWVLSGPVSHEQSSSVPAGCFGSAHAYDSSWYRLALSPGTYSISLTVTNGAGSSTASTGFTIS